MIFYWLLIVILLIDFFWSQYLVFRNVKRMSPVIPEQVENIYTKKEYSLQQAYQKENTRFGMLSSFVTFILILLILVFQLFGWLDGYLRNYIYNPVLLSVTFLGIFYFLNEIISLPFEYYSIFHIEEKFGFNKSTKKIFWTDQIKSFLLTILAGGGLLAVINWLYIIFGENFWLYTWIVITGFSLFMTLFYSQLIVPLFNKQTLLKEGELRRAIEHFSIQAGFGLKNIYVMDASKRSTKANAYFTGIGNKKRIVLFDTLIRDLSTEEIVAVLAHEIGHYKKKHIPKQMVLSVFYTGILLFILSFFLKSEPLANALGSAEPSFHLGIIAFSILFTPVSMLLGTLLNIMSRKNEYEADRYAAGFELASALISGLKKLSVKSLSNLNPDSLYVFFYYSHPTLLQRINKLKQPSTILD